MGDLLLQKTMVESYLTKKKAKNEGRLPQFYITDDHEPIVSRKTFSEVQEEIKRRGTHHEHKRGTQSVFTGKIRCAICGENYRRKITPYNTVWCCSTFNTRGKAYCASKAVPEETLKNCIAEALGRKTFNEDDFTAAVDYIIAEPENKLCLVFTDGMKKEIVWQDRSRSESWTPEMREAAKQKTLKRREQKDGQ